MSNMVTTNTNNNEDDVLLLYSRHCPGAVEWAKYLHKLYTELSKHKGKLRVRHLPVEDLNDCVLPPHMEKEITSSRLQLVLLSPTLLQFLARNSNVVIGRLFHPDRVIAIMLGVRDSQITPQHRHSLVSFAQWIHLEAKDHDLEFVQTVLYFSTQILQRGGGGGHFNLPKGNNVNNGNKRFHRLARSSSALANNCQRRSPESNSFQVHPRRLTEDMNRVMLIFETPQSSRSQIKVTLERTEAGLNDVDLDELRLLNPYNLIVTVPSCCFSVCNLASLRLEIDGANRGCRTVRLESSLSQIDHLLKMTHDPVDFMCQALGIHPACKDQLDAILSKQLVQNMPKSGFHLLNGPQTVASDPQNKDNSEFPTLLHFSACHGLSKLTSMLVDCAGWHDAIQMRNVSEMTPAELAHVNGHFDLANKLHSLHVEVFNETSKQHVYDYIQQNNYQVPPPPRPVHQKPPQKDPYGTMRAEKKLSTPPNTRESSPEEDDLDEVFVKAEDKFGTLKANKAIHKMPENRFDYRESKQTANSLNGSDELAITDEFVKLLEDFQSKNFSNKEMEMLFENWKRRAEVQDGQDDKSDSKDLKSKKQKATNLILKLFKTSNALVHSQSDPYIKATKATKTYRRPSKPEVVPIEEAKTEAIIENETIVEGEITIINADDLEEVITFPDTPQKPKESLTEGISTQILPLSRLSLSSSNSSPPNSNIEVVTRKPNNNDPPQTNTPIGRPIAEVQPFDHSDDVNQSPICRSKSSPVRDKLDKIRRSLTEPLIQYFHDLQQSSPDAEEPEILNTPKSLAPNSKEFPIINKAGIKSKTLFQDKEEGNKRAPLMVTDM